MPPTVRVVGFLDSPLWVDVLPNQPLSCTQARGLRVQNRIDTHPTHPLRPPTPASEAPVSGRERTSCVPRAFSRSLAPK